MADPGVTIRRATDHDVAALTDTRIALFTELGQPMTPSATDAFAALCRSQLASMMSSGSATAWLAVSEDGAAQGAAILLDYPRLPSPGNPRLREGYILNVFMAPAWRKRGIASALMGAAIDEARARKMGRVRLHATEQGRGVYASLGFTPRADEMELLL